MRVDGWVEFPGTSIPGTPKQAAVQTPQTAQPATPAPVSGMNTTETLLLLAGLAIAGYLVYRYVVANGTTTMAIPIVDTWTSWVPRSLRA